MACRYELFDRNPIRFVRQSAKRRTAPTLLAPIEIKMLVEGLGLRERTLVLLAASTGLRQSELFGLKWGDIDFAAGVMNVLPHVTVNKASEISSPNQGVVEIDSVATNFPISLRLIKERPFDFQFPTLGRWDPLGGGHSPGRSLNSSGKNFVTYFVT